MLAAMTAAEVLLALQNQLENPSSALRTGPFGEYASLTTIGKHHHHHDPLLLLLLRFPRPRKKKQGLV